MSATTREEIRGWVQASAIAFAGIWAGYTFIYKEIYAPKSAPINISMDLDLKQIDQTDVGDSKTKSLFPVQLKIVAKNPSIRPIYLLSSAWWAYSLNVEKRETDVKEFDKSVTDALNSTFGEYAERYTAVIDDQLVAAGSLFVDKKSLKPNEAITRTLMIYLPPKYDKLKIVIAISTSGKDPGGKLGLRWASPGQKKWYGSEENAIWTEIDDATFMDYERKFEVDDSVAISEISLRR